MACMKKAGVSSVTPDNMQNFVKGMSKDAVDAYLNSGASIYKCTVGPNEGLWTPFDSIFVETIGAVCDAVGFRFCVWMLAETERFEKVSRWFVSCKAPNSLLQNVTEALALADCD